MSMDRQSQVSDADWKSIPLRKESQQNAIEQLNKALEDAGLEVEIKNKSKIILGAEVEDGDDGFKGEKVINEKTKVIIEPNGEAVVVKEELVLKEANRQQDTMAEEQEIYDSFRSDQIEVQEKDSGDMEFVQVSPPVKEMIKQQQNENALVAEEQMAVANNADNNNDNNNDVIQVKEGFTGGNNGNGQNVVEVEEKSGNNQKQQNVVIVVDGDAVIHNAKIIAKDPVNVMSNEIYSKTKLGSLEKTANNTKSDTDLKNLKKASKSAVKGLEKLEKQIQATIDFNNPEIVPVECKDIIIDGTVISEELFIWKATNAAICQEHLHIKGTVIPLSEIEKIKILPEKIFEKYYKIKITQFGRNYIFATELTKNQEGIPLHYVWFSNLLVARVKHTGVPIPKQIKPDEDLSLQVLHENSYVGGNIWKLSKYMKRWDLRYTIINRDGLFSYKNTDEPHSFCIKAGTIQYMWTRVYYQERMLVIKIMHGKNQKTEMGIPLMDFTQKVRHNWLYHLYRLSIEYQEGLSLDI